MSISVLTQLLTGMGLLTLGLLSLIFPRALESYLDSTAGRAAERLAKHGLRWSLDLYPSQRRALRYLAPAFLIAVGFIFVLGAAT